ERELGGGPAVRNEGALIWDAALRADRHLGLLAHERAFRAAEPDGHLRGQGPRRFGDVLLDQQSLVTAIAAIDELGIDVSHGNRSRAYAARLEHPGLDRAVAQVLGLDARRAFDLHETGARRCSF